MLSRPKLICFLFSTVVCPLMFGQKVITKYEKRDYKIAEIITIVYEVDARIDSVSELEKGDFEVVYGPSESSSFSVQNGISNHTFKLSYRISPNFPGKLKISSPIFYINGKQLSGKNLNLRIINEGLTAKELEDIEFQKFRKNPGYKKGTLRYIIFNTFGYIEEFYDKEWHYKRRLSIKELKNLPKN